MQQIVDFLRKPPEPRVSWSTGIEALDRFAQFEPGRLWLIVGSPRVGKTKLLCQWAYDLAVMHGLDVGFVGTPEQSEDAYQHWFRRSIAFHRHSPDERPLIDTRLRVGRGDLMQIGDVWVVGQPESAGVLLADEPGSWELATDRFSDFTRSGRSAVVTAPRDVCLAECPGGENRLKGPWTEVADVIVELIPMRDGQVDLKIWQNRSGPTGTVRVFYSADTGRLHDLDPRAHDVRALF